MAKPDLAPTQQAVATQDNLVITYSSDLEEQARRVAREERGSRIAELVPTDYEEADRRVRRRLGRRRISVWGPVGNVSAAVAGISFSQIISGVISSSAWWQVWWHSVGVVALGILSLIASLLCAISDHN